MTKRDVKLHDIFWHSIPPTRLGVFSGRIKCPCEIQFWSALEAFLQDSSGKTVIDLGCGPGIKALTLAIAGMNVIGFDNRAIAIRHALENLRQAQINNPQQIIQAQFHQKDIQFGIPEVPDSSADYVLLVEVIEHLSDYHAILAEIYRILKPDGKAFITTPNKKFHHKEPGEKVYGEKAYQHVHEFDLEDLATAVEQVGLTILHKGYINTPASTYLCRWIHPWMIRDHAFLQRKVQIDDVIGIRTLGFLQPLYDRLFFIISAIIAGYNRLLFPLLHRLVTSNSEMTTGKTLFLVGIKIE